MKVLIAHPSAQVRRRTGALFAQLGWEALEASNADQALALSDEHQPDVALLDTRLTRPGSAAPLVDELLRPDAPTPAAVRRPVADDGLGVVLIDESPGIRQLLAAHLEDTDVSVVGEASGGAEALELVAQLRPDVVVMDMHPRGGDGLEAIRDLTARHPAAVIVGFTATDDPEVVRAMREAGAVQYFHRDDLRELVAYLDGDALAAAVQDRRAR